MPWENSGVEKWIWKGNKKWYEGTVLDILEVCGASKWRFISDRGTKKFSNLCCQFCSEILKFYPCSS